ncbi:MAG: MerR family transcriptional regulator [Lachnospiraceae bacterium]
MGWTIKQMAEKTGFAVESLRYYDKLGIVTPKRMENGYRYYSERDYVLLQYVAVMKYANFTLNEIKTVTTTLFHEPSAECNRINQDLLQCKRAELTESIRNFKSIIKFIDKVQPMLDNADAFMKNAGEIQGFIQSIYDDIRKIGWTLSN